MEGVGACNKINTRMPIKAGFDGNAGVFFLTYETETVLFLAVLENSVLPMG